ncbi:MAG TPA: M1 family aminopeptidase [Sphingomicrobium sp.]|nr:M1 family aminopeptidase [Sphingomicrobium sp.]
MLFQVAAFEFRYQSGSPLFRAATAIVFLAAFADMSLVKFGQVGGGQVLFNAPHSIIVTHHLFSMIFLFLGAAFVSNVIVRDDQTGFGPIIRSTGITKRHYLIGRFAGAFAAGALILATVPLASWLGTLMPFADQDMLCPNRASGFLYGYGLFALPNALIMSSVLFALATATRSIAGTFIGVIALFLLYLIGQRLMEGGPSLDLRMLADPFGMTTYMAASRYLTAAELNAGALPVTGLMVGSRLLWLGVSLLLLALTVYRFRFSERRISRRRQRKLAREAAAMQGPPASPVLASLPFPRFRAGTSLAQFAGRAGMEARYIFKSPLFLFLLGIAFFLTFINLLAPTGWMDLPLYPVTSIAVPIIDISFRTILIICATYFGGELVWRERERKMHEIIDATPLPAWALMLPKMAGLSLVLVATLLVGTGAGLLAQMLAGIEPQFGQFFSWYLLPAVVDALVVATLAVFVAAISPSKYAAWGVMFAYAMVLTFGPSLGLAYPLFIYGNVPTVSLTEMAGTGAFAPAAWWFRLFWAAAALLLLVTANALWPRGSEQGLATRLSSIRVGPVTTAAGIAAILLLAGTGSWIVYNTRFLNSFTTAEEQQRHLAEFEKRYFRYAGLPQPSVAALKLDVALYPEQLRAEVSGSYQLVNASGRPIERVHLRLMNPDLDLAALDFPGAQLERDDTEFDYRIYRLDRPMQPGEQRSLSFRTVRQQRGFRAVDTEVRLSPNGTVIDTLSLTPRIGMSDVGLLEEPPVRRKYRLPETPPFPRLRDIAATQLVPNGADGGFTATDITISTTADQVPMSSGRRVSDRVANGRRIARFISDGPTKNLVPVQSGRFAVATANGGGVGLAVYHHPAHRWNVQRMITAMRASLDYYRTAFGPYQFGQLSIVESPYGQGGHAYPNELSVGTAIFTMDQRDPDQLDMVTMLTAHEVAHQWWGHQVLGARMQGGSLLYETLSQYSALMVLKKLRGDDDIRRFLKYQLDRYLSGRRTHVLAEQPLASVEISQQHIAYGKGALALYLLQHRLGEDAVNHALRRFVERYRFAGAPYPRSVDLIAMLRQEARSAEDQALITDLLERITLYDLKVEAPTAVRRGDGKWVVTVPVEAKKFYADGKGAQKEAPLAERVDIGLFTADPRGGGFTRANVVGLGLQKVRSGRQLFRFVTDRKPSHAGVDPYTLYIDRISADNVAEVTG